MENLSVRTHYSFSQVGMASLHGVQRIDYSSEERRLQSFTNWDPNYKQTPKVLAEAGFYYTGTADKVVCFMCKGGIYEWEAEDDPKEEHEKHYPDCEFIKPISSKLINNS